MSVREKILPREQKWLAAGGGPGIGKAIAVVQAGRMPLLAEFPPRPTRHISLLDIDRRDLDTGLVQPQIELCGASFSKTRFNHHRQFEQGCRGNKSQRRVHDLPLQCRGILFIERDRDSRRVDYH